MREEQQRPLLPAEHDYFTGDQPPRPDNPIAPSMGPVVTGFDHATRPNGGALLNQGSSFTEMNMEFLLQTDSSCVEKGCQRLLLGRIDQ